MKETGLPVAQNKTKKEKKGTETDAGTQKGYEVGGVL